ncbi:MAG TPA: SGNH/GDSL hydrolase family protein [Gammaproteobacteria bacterium]
MKIMDLINKQLCISLVAFNAMLFGVQAPVSAHEPEGRAAGHIVIGDSIECSVSLDIGSPVIGDGYINPYHDYLESQLDVDMDLVNLCVLGATSREINIDQLPRAVVESINHDLVIVTLGGGGNNLRRFITSPQAATCARGNLSCLTRLNALLNESEQNLRLALQSLRSAAGEDSVLQVRTQYNALRGTSILGTPCADPNLIGLADLALEGGVPFLEEGLNDRIRRVAEDHNAGIADIFDAFFANPDLIAGDCIHPTDEGYSVIKDAFTFAF